MKHKGCNFELESERNEELMQAYRKLISEADRIDINDVYKKISQMPSSRFWVTEWRAAIVLSRMFNGKHIGPMKPHKRAMYDEIFARAKVIRESNPNMTWFMLAFNVVRQPAPSFYLTSNSIKVTLIAERRRRRLKKIASKKNNT